MPEPRVEYARTLERGLGVLTSFDRSHTAMTMAEVATRCGLSRAAARRYLLTLEKLGYVTAEDGHYSLTVKVLRFCDAYLGGQPFWDAALPHMRAVSARLGEACSLGVLDWPDVVYVARVPVRRIMTVALHVGSRLPAAATSMGQVLLAGLDPRDLDWMLAEYPPRAYTPRTLTDPAALRARIEAVRRDGYALVDQELEAGLRSVAVPIRDGAGQVVAAMNMSAQAGRTSIETMRDRYLPALREAARHVMADMGGLAFHADGAPAPTDRSMTGEDIAK